MAGRHADDFRLAYAGIDFKTFDNYDWDVLRKETADPRKPEQHIAVP
jgi:hypothetical protein